MSPCVNVLRPTEYVDTSESGLVKGVIGQPKAVPHVELNLESDQGPDTVLCGLISSLTPWVDILLGNDRQDLEPLHVGMGGRQ